MINFYDTNALIELQDDVLECGRFAISSITYKELEHIKTSYNKAEDVKYKARHALELLDKHEDMFDTIIFKPKMIKGILKSFDLTDDLRIIACALECGNGRLFQKGQDVTFISGDRSCRKIAETCGLTTKGLELSTTAAYTGFKVITYNDIELANFYSNILTNNIPMDDILINQYIIIKNTQGWIIDKYKWTGEKYIQVQFRKAESKLFGKIVPKDGDVYQLLALDSLASNKMTVLRGPAGSGKSLLAMAYLFQELEKGRIDKIVMFVNPVATKDSCKFGFLPGTLLDKILGSQIGNFLSSKLGGMEMIYQLIEKGLIEFVALADARGYDTSGMNCGIYITESQNMNKEHMKLMLTRVGEDSIIILDGDSDAQVDMAAYDGNNNGLRRVCEVFKNEDYFGTVTLQKCYRSRIAEKALEL